MLAREADHPVSIFHGEVEDRCPQANQDELRLADDQLPADQFSGFFPGLGFGQERLCPGFWVRTSR